MKSCLIVIPTYNEKQNLMRLIPAIMGMRRGISILVVDDNSPDGTGDTAERLAEQFRPYVYVMHRPDKEGLGRAYLDGFGKALGGYTTPHRPWLTNTHYIGHMDADLSHPPDRLPAMIRAMDEADLVIGSRYVNGGELDTDWPIWRKWLSWFGNHYARAILGSTIQDLTGGFRIWNRGLLQWVMDEGIRSRGYSFMIEMAIIAERMGARIRELPIKFTERSQGCSKMSMSIQAEAALRVLQLRHKIKRMNIPENVWMWRHLS